MPFAGEWKSGLALLSVNDSGSVCVRSYTGTEARGHWPSHLSRWRCLSRRHVVQSPCGVNLPGLVDTSTTSENGVPVPCKRRNLRHLTPAYEVEVIEIVRTSNKSIGQLAQGVGGFDRACLESTFIYLALGDQRLDFITVLVARERREESQSSAAHSRETTTCHAAWTAMAVRNHTDPTPPVTGRRPGPTPGR